MKKKNIFQEIFSSKSSKKGKNKLFLSKERDWLLSTDDKEPEFVLEDDLSEDLFLKQKSFVIDYLGIPNQAFHSYRHVSSVENFDYSLIKINLLYKGSKNYIYHVLCEAQAKKITDDIIIKIVNEENHVMNTITLAKAEIYSISVFNKLSKNKKTALRAEVVFIHKTRKIE